MSFVFLYDKYVDDITIDQFTFLNTIKLVSGRQCPWHMELEDLFGHFPRLPLFLGDFNNLLARHCATPEGGI